ncbi:MAG TPA: toprim domain-containing protein [Bacteroidales bacterium]|nr:toprim domain-containing protein [Bacteroidales bacterium]HOX78452.1 toprim domain-containing protein [Bacteroidales bacterium]
MINKDLSHTSIIDYLELNGHLPVRVIRGNAWYLSPLRDEKTPSFNVNLFKNMWYDFGIGAGGNLYHLMDQLKEFRIPQSRESLWDVRNIEIKRLAWVDDEKSHINILYTRNLQNKSLLEYLKSRRISIFFARKFAREAYYTVHDKKYYAIAFKNDLGGFELRNAFFKTGSSPKHFTTIPGSVNSKLLVFEGFMDFLSACTYFKRVPQCKCIILNSLSFLPKIEDELARAESISLFFDNDTAGRVATRKIMENHGQVIDRSQTLFSDYKDFNDFLMGKKITQCTE